jgi:hypothetical protein
MGDILPIKQMLMIATLNFEQFVRQSTAADWFAN